ncbi:hypothetical protein PO124_10485 [Bacillus licheniformis]|nr:hypothetical protein [Bacillus licheniformis]
MNRPFLTGTGIQMLLRRLIEEHKGEFKVYQTQAIKRIYGAGGTDADRI